MGRIRVLPPESARLIAAGEVIDRPASVLRELLDNALDAGATSVSVELTAGGIEGLRVADDGLGMDAEDLALSIQPHATSKIRSADDLLVATSLGFRGEALPSIAAAARLSILSRDSVSPAASRLRAGPGEPTTVEKAPGPVGTSVEVTRLFENYPARRAFLKPPAAEGTLCRQVLVDKALAHPAVGFRLSLDGKPPLVLPPAARAARVADCHPEAPRSLVYSVRFSGAGFEGEAVIAGPAYCRDDRRLMQVFVNRRRVQEWPLLAALDRAFEGFLPGGTHPYAFLFLEIDPALADFNIHPAKREVRLKDPDSPRRALQSAVGDFLRGLARVDPGALAPQAARELGFGPGFMPGSGPGPGAGTGDPARDGEDRPAEDRSAPGAGYATSYAFRSRPGAESWAAFESLRERPAPRPGAGPAEAGGAGGLRYLGQAFGLFLVVERGEELFLIDQHAAHERLLFDELSSRPPVAQELLLPARYEAADEAEDARIEAALGELAAAGFRIERSGGAWELLAAPVLLRGGAEAVFAELAAGLGGAGGDPGRSARALAACKAAIKDGDALEDEAALDLARRALGLGEPRCPHGRPVWVRLTREELFRLVRRLV